MTNDEGLTAVINIVLHVAANMYSKRGKGDAHDPGPQSPPNVYGSKTESYVIRRSPESVTKSAKRKKQHRNTPVVRRRGKLLKTDSKAMASRPEETTNIQLLPRHDAPTDTEATAPDGKIYVCPQPECEQHFHKDTTRALVVEYLMYDHRTEFSALKGETRCPFGWNKGFHDYDLLKLHIQKIECEMDEMVGSETFSDAAEYQDRLSFKSGRFGCGPCDMGFDALDELFSHTHDGGCLYMIDNDIMTAIPTVDEGGVADLLQPQLLQRLAFKRR